MKNGLIVTLLASLIITGCANYGGQLTRNQVLQLDPEADLIELEDDSIYKHGVEWIEEKDLTKGEKIGVIKKGMATKLPVGAIIYEVNESYPILMVEYEGETKRYLLAQGE
ncbi:hypothetical protein [Oceanobacillus kapialis]|uniref:DUF3221 domain-containing protein n=1 Tax=Oceanobacillus kapialis TaxID=481353 RepID=A0ABW5Q3Q4_9BACI